MNPDAELVPCFAYVTSTYMVYIYRLMGDRRLFQL